MATVSSSRATSPVNNTNLGGVLHVAYGTYEISSALSQNDLIEFCALPAGATVVFGFLSGDDLDTGTEALEIDVGDGTDADFYLDSGVISGDAVSDLVPTYASGANFFLPFNGITKNGPRVPAADSDDENISKVIGTVTAAAAAGGTGTVNCTVFYLVP